MTFAVRSSSETESHGLIDQTNISYRNIRANVEIAGPYPGWVNGKKQILIM